MRKHKRSGTGAGHMYPAFISLTQDDHTLFAQYRTNVRRPMADEMMEMTDDALFFTTLGGKGYTNASSEIDKMQRKCGVRRVSSNAARHWMETISRYGTTADQDGIGAYLTHRVKVKVQVNHAIITMERLIREEVAKDAGQTVPVPAADDQPGTSGVSSRPGDGGVSTGNSQTPSDDDDNSSSASGDGDVLDALLAAFPADGEEPTNADIRSMLPPAAVAMDRPVMSLLKKWRHHNHSNEIRECPPTRVVTQQIIGKGKGKGKGTKRAREDDETPAPSHPTPDLSADMSHVDMNAFVKLRRFHDGHM